MMYDDVKVEDSIDLLSSIDSEDLSYAIDSDSEAVAWVDGDNEKASRLIVEAMKIILRERRDGGDTKINEIAWDAISQIAKVAISQAFREIDKP
jgi:hypothetical protein